MNLTIKFSLKLIYPFLCLFMMKPVIAQTGSSELDDDSIKEVTASITNTGWGSVQAGSGVVIKSNADNYFIITNAHVLTETNPELYKVTLQPTSAGFGGPEECANIQIKHLGNTNNPNEDIALLQCVATSSDRPVAELSSSYPPVNPNDSVFASGYPQAQPTFTTIPLKIVSSTPQTTLTYESVDRNTPMKGGMSGGSVFNQQNQLVGIHQGVNKDDPNIFQGIPINIIQTTLAPYLQSTPIVSDFSTPTDRQMNVDENPVRGVTW